MWINIIVQQPFRIVLVNSGKNLIKTLIKDHIILNIGRAET